MKILFLLGFPNPFPGAAWTRIGFFADYFRNKGHVVYVAGVFSPYSINKAGLRFWKNMRIYNVCLTIWIGGIISLLFNIFTSFITFPLLLIFLLPDLTIISVPPGEPAVGAYFASKLVRAKVVFDVRDEWEDYTINKSKGMYRRAYETLKDLMTKMYAKSDVVIAVTQNIAESLRERGVSDVKVVPNGADTEVFKPFNKLEVRKKLNLNAEDFIIVYEGGIGGYYRLDVVIEALSKLNGTVREKVKLILVGEGPDLQKIMRMAKTLGLNDNIIYLGVKNDKTELAEILSAADVGIVPYDDNPLWKNTIPAKFFEYCSCGIPVLATCYKDSVLGRLIEEHEIGITLPPLCVGKLIEAIHMLCADRIYCERAGARARILIEKRFDRNRLAEELLSVLRRLA